MLRARRKRRETLTRLKKISAKGHNKVSLVTPDINNNDGTLSLGTLASTTNNLTTTNTNIGTCKKEITSTSQGPINLVTEETTNNKITSLNKENNKVDPKKVNLDLIKEPKDLTAFQENPKPDSSYSLPNLPSFRRTFLPRNFVFFIILVYPRQIRYYKVQNKQIHHLTTNNTRHCRNRKNIKGAIFIMTSCGMTKEEIPSHLMAYNTESTNNDTSTQSKHVNNALSDLWSHDKYMGSICRDTRLHKLRTFLILNILYLIQRTCTVDKHIFYQVYHRPLDR